MPIPAARFGSNLIGMLCGGLLVLAAFAFAAAHLVWIAFGLGVITVVSVLVAFAFPGRGAVQRMLDLLLGGVGGWTILTSLLDSAPHLVRWMSVGEGAAIAGLGFIGLLVHEGLLERDLRAARRVAAATTEGLIRTGEAPARRGDLEDRGDLDASGPGRLAQIRESLP